jgi:uncharacterized protein
MKTHISLGRLSPKVMRSQSLAFSVKIKELARLIGLDLRGYDLDHVAMRINDAELAVALHQAWMREGREISHAQINGRSIIVFELVDPILLDDWTTSLVELPYPAVGKSYPTQGWEHVEFVVESDCINVDDYLNELFVRFPQLQSNWERLAHEGIQIKLSSPKGDGERLANPTVAFKWQGVCIKLHPHALKEVIDSERSTSTAKSCHG